MAKRRKSFSERQRTMPLEELNAPLSPPAKELLLFMGSHPNVVMEFGDRLLVRELRLKGYLERVSKKAYLTKNGTIVSITFVAGSRSAAPAERWPPLNATLVNPTIKVVWSEQKLMWSGLENVRVK